MSISDAELKKEYPLLDYFYINDLRVASSSGKTRTNVNPHLGIPNGEFQEASEDDTVKAILAAREAFDSGIWTSVSSFDRSKILASISTILYRDKKLFAAAESLDTAKRISESLQDVDDSASVFLYYSNLAETSFHRDCLPDQTEVRSTVIHEPVGVVSMITPWNYPLLQASWKIAPAIAAGCTFVIKPSEFTPRTTSMLMQVLCEAGLPRGVANLILGSGPSAGGPMSTHEAVDMISFTGGLETGKHLMGNASKTIKRVALELGGKNPNIIFEDSDLDVAIDNAVFAAFLHSGQTCSAGTRLIVERSIHERVAAEIARRADLIVLGGPYDEEVEAGPLINEAHLAKIERFVRDALKEGAVLLAGGSRPTETHLRDGFFFRPTVLGSCKGEMRCVQEESFGPILTIETFDTEQEAVEIGNNTIFGLAGAVWTQDLEKAARIAGSLRHGTIWINDFHPYVAQAEWGGFKQSGLGRELGPGGLSEYLETKHIWENRKPSKSGWFVRGTSRNGIKISK
jgi:betaine-aldehyde dehydrogenase